MSDAWLGLVGVVVGVLGTLGAGSLATRASERQGRAIRQQERQDRVRELAALAYVSAVDAVQWLSSMHVEDSVDPQFSAEYEPKTQRALASLAEARQAMTQVFALGGTSDLASVAAETVVALTTLGDSWERAQDYQRRIVAGSKGKGSFEQRRFSEEFARLNDARERLCGTSAQLPWREIDAGLVQDGSLLSRLRSVTARFD